MTPNGWLNTTIGALVEIKRGLTWQSDQEAAEPGTGTVPVLRIPNIQDTLQTSDLRYLVGVTADEKARHAAAKNWILMVGSNGNPKRVGNCVIVEDDTDYLFASFLLGIRASDTNKTDPRYLFHLLRSNSVQAAISESVQGSTGLRNISVKMLRSLAVDVPPLPEQKKIAAILGSVDNAIQATQAVIDQTRKVKQGLLQQLLTRGIGHTRFKQTEIGELPEHWQVLPAEEVCDSVIDCKNRTPAFTDAGYPVVRTPNVRDGRFVTTDLKFTDRESYEEWTKRGKPRPGDVLITREAPVGEVCLVPDGLDVCLGQRMMLYRPNPQRLDNGFMLMALLSPLIQDRLLLLAGGSTVGHVRVGDIRSLLIPVPPLDEQRQIALVLGAVDESLDAARLRLETMTSLKIGLMADLLTGRKRVEASA